MPKPNLSGASFPTLRNGMGQQSSGTITATNVATGNTVTITGNGNKKWSGPVGTNASGNTWNVTVTRVGNVVATAIPPKEMGGVETVTVTVANPGGESNPVDTNSDVVP
jgi:hypothetical protein